MKPENALLVNTNVVFTALKTFFFPLAEFYRINTTMKISLTKPQYSDLMLPVVSVIYCSIKLNILLYLVIFLAFKY